MQSSTNQLVHHSFSHLKSFGLNRTMVKLSNAVANEDQKQLKQQRIEAKKKKEEQHRRKEERCLLTDDQVREIRRASEVDKIPNKEIYKIYSVKYGLDKQYIYGILNYTVRSKVYI